VSNLSSNEVKPMVDESIIISQEYLQHSRMSGLIMHGIEQKSFVNSIEESEFEK